MQLVKGAETCLPKSLIKLNTVTIAVVGATSASSEISQAWNTPGRPEGIELGGKNHLPK